MTPADVFVVILCFCWMILWTVLAAGSALEAVRSGNALGLPISAVMLGVGAIALIGLWPWRHVLWGRRRVTRERGRRFEVAPARPEENED